MYLYCVIKKHNKMIELKLSEIVESPFNPRKKFDEKVIAELAKSIQEVGVIQPILVRKKGKKYEIVCGARRYRASVKAEVKTIPAIVRELTDDQALDLAITENLQREDIHPLDEAIAIAALKDRKLDINEIASKLGKSVPFVYNRIKLTSLTEDFQKAFHANKVRIMDAIEICKLPSHAQDSIFEEKFSNWEDVNFSPKVWGLENAISRATNSLGVALWDLNEENIVEGKPACNSCPFNSACMGSLFIDENAKKTCLDAECYKQKDDVSKQRIVNEMLENGYFGIGQRYNMDWYQKALEMGVEEQLLLKDDVDCERILEPSEPDKPKKPTKKSFIDDIGKYYDTQEEAIEEFNSAMEDYEEEVDKYESDIAEYKTDLKEYNEKFNSENAVFGIWLTSSGFGKKYLIEIKSTKKSSNNPKSNETVKAEQIKKWETKETRNEELDVVKRQKLLMEKFTNSINGLPNQATPLSETETVSLLYLLVQNIPWGSDQVWEFLGVKGNMKYDRKALIDALTAKNTPAFLAYLTRLAMIKNYGTCYEPSTSQKAMEIMAVDYLGEEEVKNIDDERNAEIKKRKERLKEKINNLK